MLSWPFVFKQLLKLNWMFYVLSPTFQKHNTAKNLFSCFPTCHTPRQKRNNTKISQFLYGARTQAQRIDNEDERIFPLCQTCELDVLLCICYLFTYGKCAPAEIFNASDYQKQIFSRAFYSSISWCKAQKDKWGKSGASNELKFTILFLNSSSWIKRKIYSSK